jgi:hypothetical protein
MSTELPLIANGCPDRMLTPDSRTEMPPVPLISTVCSVVAPTIVSDETFVSPLKPPHSVTTPSRTTTLPVETSQVAPPRSRISVGNCPGEPQPDRVGRSKLFGLSRGAGARLQIPDIESRPPDSLGI